MHIEVKLPDLTNLIDNEIGLISDITNDFKNSDSESKSKNSSNKSENSKWSSISIQNLNKLNDNIANPFEALANLMNKSNIINISTEPVTVKIPMIFAEDINSYVVYLNQWLDTNSVIVQEWSNALSTFKDSCEKEDTDAKKQACYDRAESYWKTFVEFEQVDWPRMMDQIYANLRILQEYRNFPFEIYEWIHVIDKYMSEIT